MRPWVTVSVYDDGPGMPSQRAGARTSLRILDEHLHRFGGAVVADGGKAAAPGSWLGGNRHSGDRWMSFL